MQDLTWNEEDNDLASVQEVWNDSEGGNLTESALQIEGDLALIVDDARIWRANLHTALFVLRTQVSEDFEATLQWCDRFGEGSRHRALPELLGELSRRYGDVLAVLDEFRPLVGLSGSEADNDRAAALARRLAVCVCYYEDLSVFLRHIRGQHWQPSARVTHEARRGRRHHHRGRHRTTRHVSTVATQNRYRQRWSP